MAQKSNYSKLAQLRREERARAVQGNSALLQGLTPTQIAELFPDYFKRGTPDIGGFAAAISKESAKRTALWQQGVNERLKSEGSWLEKLRSRVGGGGAAGPSGYGSTVASGTLKQNQQEAYKAARAEGLSDKAARILVANLSGENLKQPGKVYSDPSTRNPNQHAHGIAAWEESRAEKIKGQFGRYPQEMSVADQTKAVIWEMKRDYKGAWAKLNDESLSDYDRMYGVVDIFERPKDSAGSTADRMKMLNGFKPDETTINQTTPPGTDQKKGETPKQGQQTGGQQQQAGAGGQTPQSGGGGGTQQPQASTKFKVVSGFVVPQDPKLYDQRNAKQCATLGKAFNPAIDRSSTWSVVDADIKPGQVVATKQYNNGGNDREHAGYHTGVALTAPNEKGDFLLLEQHNKSGGAQTKWVNKNAYPIPGTGQYTSFGLIRSNGKLHDEISQEALTFGRGIAPENQKQIIGTNSGTPDVGGAAAPGVSTASGDDLGQLAPVPQTPEEQLAAAMNQQNPVDGDAQTATVLNPMASTPNLMGAMQGGPMGMMGMLGGMMGGQSASPLGLITTAMGFIMPLIGSLGAGKGQGEGIGDGGVSSNPLRDTSHIGGAMKKYKDVIQAKFDSPDYNPVYRSSLGTASKTYESGKLGVENVSSGKGPKGRPDPGGISYGSHQLASKTKGESKPTGGTMMEFLKSPEGSKIREHFQGLFPGTAAFNEKYKQLTAQGSETRSQMEEAQNSFLTRTHYEPARIVAEHLGYDVKDPRVQETLYSMAIQHRNNLPKYLESPRAMSSIGASAEEQVKALFDVRAHKNPSLAGKGKRFDPSQERASMLKIDVAGMSEEQKMAEAKAANASQFAQAQPAQTTSPVSNNPMVLAQSPNNPSFMERIKTYASEQYAALKDTRIGRLAASSGAIGSGGSIAKGPYVYDPNRPTAGSTDLAFQPKPGGAGITPQAMRAAGLNPTSDRSFATAFGANKDLSASVIPTQQTTVAPTTPGAAPQTNVPAAPAAPVSTTPVKGAMMQAPGPAPSTDGLQMKQMAAVTAAVSSTASDTKQAPNMQPASGVTHQNHDATMKLIQQPADNPSMHRAFARAFGQEGLTRPVGGDFSYGNSA